MARRSRAIVETARPKYRVWRIAIYIRLSKEDMRCLDESESVTNQRQIIEDHIAGFNDGDEYIIVDEYVDDGISGTTDDEREDFQRMLSDIKRGRVNCVIVKDLARSFRNYSDQGYYLDDWFPRYNVRFISLYHQPLDSYKEPQNMRSIAVPIQGVLNENHCAETSDKVREVFDMKRRNGEHIGSFAAYGYIKDPNDKNALVVDGEAAEVVREIFTKFLDGMSKNAIVHYLNEHGVLSPAAYKRERLGLKYQNPSIDPAKRPLWCAVTITVILKNRMYCGDMVQGRYRMKSYKVHVQEVVPEDEWYIVENTHEAIIDRETFALVQELRQHRRRPTKSGIVSMFSGLLYCADCGEKLYYSVTNNYKREQAYFFCSAYRKNSDICSAHYIREKVVEQLVLESMQRVLWYVQSYEKLFAQRQLEEFGEKQKKELAEKRRELDKAKLRVREIDGIIQKLYEDNATGKISDERFATMSVSLENEQSELKDRIPALENELENAKIKTEGLQRFIDKAKQVTRLESRPNWYTNLLRKSWYPHPNTRTASAVRKLKSTTTALVSSESRQQKKWKNTSKNTSAKSLS